MCWLSYTLTILYKVLMDYILPQVYQSLNNFLFKITKKSRGNPPRPFLSFIGKSKNVVDSEDDLRVTVICCGGYAVRKQSGHDKG